jgi:electron transfer flavoprotein beta subunit|tara:strand:- start:800 stop:1555 length:756 start_codon:yes stop_codon:yes gene_type:complete
MIMKILVCISSVPDTTTKISFTNNNTEFNKSGVQFVINPNDEFGLTKALQLKEANPGSTVSVIHVGPATSDPIIRKSLAIGADDAIRIDTEAVDALQVANEIAVYIKANPFDLIITGKESIDYNGAIVPHALGEILGIPSVSPCIGLEIDGAEAKLTGIVDGGKEEFSASLPVVAGGQKGIVEEKDLRIPNMRGIMQARSKPLNVVAASGSTASQKIADFDAPTPKAACKMVDANNMEELVNLLQNEAKVI